MAIQIILVPKVVSQISTKSDYVRRVNCTFEGRLLIRAFGIHTLNELEKDQLLGITFASSEMYYTFYKRSNGEVKAYVTTVHPNKCVLSKFIRETMYIDNLLDFKKLVEL